MNVPLLVIVLVAVIGALLICTIRPHDHQEGDPDRIIHTHYTAHARQRMNERQVTCSQVEAVVARPTRFHRDPAQRSVRLERDFSKGTLKVWVAEPWDHGAHTVTVKTTAWCCRETFSIPTEAIGRVIGCGGRTIEEISSLTGSHIHIRDDGTVLISGDNALSSAAAKARVLDLVGRASAPTRDPFEGR